MAINTVSLEQILTDFTFSIDSDYYVNNASDTTIRNLARRGIRDLGFDIMKRIKAVDIAVSATDTITLPTDYVDMLKLGVVGEDGLVYIFGENNNKNLLANSSGDLPDYMLGYSDFIYRNFLGAEGRIYGYGGGKYNGEYRINLEENRIELTLGTSVTSVYMEYIADEARATNPSVHVYAEQAIRAYIYYRLVERKSNVPAVEKQRARQEYYNERRLANSRLKAFSKEEALKTIRKNFVQSPKY